MKAQDNDGYGESCCRGTAAAVLYELDLF